MVNRKGYRCGEAADALVPCRKHYRWHKYWGTTPCPKSLFERRWWEAEKREGRSLPDGPPPSHNHICGDIASVPNEAHYIWHRSRSQRTTPCPKSVEERAWRRAELRAGRPLPEWKRPSRVSPPHICGDAESASGASEAHYRWHLYRKETPCPAAVAERRWLTAERTAGKPLEREEAAAMSAPRRYECGDVGDYREPFWGHYAQHRRRGEEPCPKSKKEASEANKAAIVKRRVGGTE